MQVAPQQSSKQTYWELLKHPNWQRKRLEVLSRENFTCEQCSGQSETLHVHHTYYEKGLKPWEYPNESLRVLCERCHAVAQTLMQVVQCEVGKLQFGEQLEVLGVALGMQMTSVMTERMPVCDDAVARGVARVFGTNADFIRRHSNENGTICGDEIVAALASVGEL